MLKTCNVCKVAMELSGFSKRAKSKDGLCHTCKSCAAERNRAWRENNPDGYRSWAEKNRDRLRGNWVEWSSKNKGKRSENYARWVEENRPRVYARNAARVSAKIQATPGWADMQKIDEFYERAVTLTKMTGVRHEVDHYYPLRGEIVCGLHCQDNLQILTRSENARKKNKMPEELQ